MGVSSPVMKGRPVQDGLLSGALSYWNRFPPALSELELVGWKITILLVFIHLSQMYVQLTFISMFNIRKVLCLYLEA